MYLRGNPSRPVDVRYSKTPLLKLLSVFDHLSFLSLHYAGLETTESLARICQMLPGNSSHPSLYPELDSVPFLYRPFWDRVYGTILVTLSLFLLALIRLRRRLGQNDPFRAKRSRGTKKQRTAWDAVGEEKQRDFTIRKITSLFVSDPLRRLPTRKVFLYRVTVKLQRAHSSLKTWHPPRLKRNLKLIWRCDSRYVTHNLQTK